MKYTLQYVTSALFLFCSLLIGAQEEVEIKPIDSIKYTQDYGLRLGTDFGKLIRTFVDEEYSGFEINGDFRITNKLYAAGEFGIEEKITATDFLNTTAKGSYIKLGIDYNMYTNWLGMNNMIYSGFRTGFSTFSQTLNSYSVYSQDQFWEPQFTTTESETFNDLTSVWLEFIIGIKAEIFNNFFIGINAQLKTTLSEKSPDNFENLYIPGFNKTYDSSNFGVGYGYTVSYLIPLFKINK